MLHMESEVVTNSGTDSFIGARSSVTEMICDACGCKLGRGMLANSKLCPACGGNLVGIRIFRNALTGKILFAERVDF